jgi:hypothetical protein
MAASDEILRHTVVVDGYYTSDFSWITMFYHGVRFQICTELHDLQHTPFEQEYLALAKKLEIDYQVDGEAETKLQNWLLRPCFPQIRELIPEKPRSSTLQAFYFPRTYLLEVVAWNGSLLAEVCYDDVGPEAGLVPKMIPSEQFADYPELPRIFASNIATPPYNLSDATHWEEFLSKVKTADGVTKFFKPARQRETTIREIENNIRIQQTTFEKQPRVPKLCGILVSDDGQMLLGLLFDLICYCALCLFHDECIEKVESHKKWEAQIFESLTELHKNGIIWGNVNPGHIVIDDNDDAWIVDFGGSQLIHAEQPRTKQGDCEAVRLWFSWLEERALRFVNRQP